MKKERAQFAILLHQTNTNIHEDYIAKKYDSERRTHWKMTLTFVQCLSNGSVCRGLAKFVDNLEVECFWRSDHQQKYWRTYYEGEFCGAITLDRARIMHTTLAKIFRYRTRHNEAKSFGEYVTQVCEALGIDTVCIRTRGDSITYSDNSYEFYDIDEGLVGGLTLAELINEEIRQHDVKHAEVA